MLSLLLLGFLLGIRHALEADHIATVASLASTHSNRKQMLKQGLAWGIGHSITLMTVAGSVMIIDDVIPETMAVKLEMLVGVMMALLGIDVIRRARKSHVHMHSHQGVDGSVHLSLHSHSDAEIKNHDVAHHATHGNADAYPIKALLLGLIHGIAGSAALVLIFVEQIDSLLNGLFYLTTFSVGSIVGMMLFSVVISFPIVFTAKRFAGFQSGLQYIVGGLTGVLGIGIVMQGFVVL